MLFIVLEEYIDSFIILDSLGLAVVPDIQITMNRDKRHIKNFINLVMNFLLMNHDLLEKTEFILLILIEVMLLKHIVI